MMSGRSVKASVGQKTDPLWYQNSIFIIFRPVTRSPFPYIYIFNHPFLTNRNQFQSQNKIFIDRILFSYKQKMGKKQYIYNQQCQLCKHSSTKLVPHLRRHIHESSLFCPICPKEFPYTSKAENGSFKRYLRS